MPRCRLSLCGYGETSIPSPLSLLFPLPRFRADKPMGSICSKSSTHTGGHTVLGGDSPASGQRPSTRPSQQQSPSEARAAAAEAAENRLKAVSHWFNHLALLCSLPINSVHRNKPEARIPLTPIGDALLPNSRPQRRQAGYPSPNKKLGSW